MWQDLRMLTIQGTNEVFLSIITINFNNAKGLRKTIESVKNQTSKNYEHIIIDGGSTDESVSVIREFISDSEYAKQVAYWCSEKDKGIYDAMNKGIPHAKGRYCLFLNSGDYLADSDVVSRFDNYNLNEDIIYTNAIFFNSKKEWKKKYPEKVTALYFYTHALSHQNTLIKLDCQKKHYYSTKFKIVSDMEFYLHTFLQEGITQRHIDDVISKFEMESGISATQITKAEEEQKEMRKLHFSPVMIESLDYLFSEEKKQSQELDDYRNGYKGLLRRFRAILLFIANHTVRKNSGEKIK